MSKVRFVHVSTSVTNNPETGTIIEVCAVDDKGRIWAFDCEEVRRGWHLMESPDEPKENDMNKDLETEECAKLHAGQAVCIYNDAAGQQEREGNAILVSKLRDSETIEGTYQGRDYKLELWNVKFVTGPDHLVGNITSRWVNRASIIKGEQNE